MKERKIAPWVWFSAAIAAWALHFALVYGGTALACARGLPNLVPWVVALPTVAAAGALLVLIASARRHGEDFIRWVAGGIAALALVAVIWEALAVLRVPACA